MCLELQAERRQFCVAYRLPVLPLGLQTILKVVAVSSKGKEKAQLLADPIHGCCCLEAQALIDACDLVITVSNTTAHLAAALGKPTIVLLPNVDSLFWYWHRDSGTTPWYPNVRMFRRSDSGLWDDVIDAATLTLLGIQ
jgi:ADP-heptose:LPS heptosyltransferase